MNKIDIKAWVAISGLICGGIAQYVSFSVRMAVVETKLDTVIKLLGNNEKEKVTLNDNRGKSL